MSMNLSLLQTYELAADDSDSDQCPQLFLVNYICKLCMTTKFVSTWSSLVRARHTAHAQIDTARDCINESHRKQTLLHTIWLHVTCCCKQCTLERWLICTPLQVRCYCYWSLCSLGHRQLPPILVLTQLSPSSHFGTQLLLYGYSHIHEIITCTGIMIIARIQIYL